MKQSIDLVIIDIYSLTDVAMRTTSFFIALTALMLSLHQHALAQFPATLKLSARNAGVVNTPVTRTDARYRVTVSGTYSQWPQFPDCHGVDAVWVYDVPQQEIDAYRWPPKSILGAPFVEIPHWVGDSTVYSFPPKSFGISPLLELSFRKYLGFRINGEPLPAITIDRTFHRYQIVMAGTGEPFSLQILDSTYNIAQGAVLPRYEDNCGELTIIIEEIIEKDVNICGAEPIKVGNEVVGIRIDASIVRLDTTAIGGSVNELASKDQLGIVADGKFICADSLVCDSARSENVSICLIVDVSGSMNQPIDYGNKLVQRIDALKSSIHSFMRKLNPGDSLCLIQFNSVVQISEDWTADTAVIGRAVDRLVANGSTAFHRALIIGLQKLSTHSRAKKAIVALTDGLNNEAPTDSVSVLSAIRQANIPLYLIALGFANNSTEAAGITNMRRFVAAAPSGKVYQITTGEELEKVYTDFAVKFANDECCKLYFRIPPCSKGQSKRTISLVFVDGDKIITKKIEIDCDLKTTSISPDRPKGSPTENLSAHPTPTDEEAAFDVVLTQSGYVTSEIIASDGRVVSSGAHGFADVGLLRIILNTSDLPNGVYAVRIKQGNDNKLLMMVVQH